ncbi:hypothetical protein C8J55DRAFT_254884, partial [Lentinula edodes]
SNYSTYSSDSWIYRYLGARVGSESPFHQLSIEEVWKDSVWTERFPCRDQVCEYYQHIERTLGYKEEYTVSIVELYQQDSTMLLIDGLSLLRMVSWYNLDSSF